MNIDSALVGMNLCAVASLEYQGTLEVLEKKRGTIESTFAVMK